ncbi:MAG: hypothetical protein AAF493_23510 [Pseudomonadota bacterium]
MQFMSIISQVPSFGTDGLPNLGGLLWRCPPHVTFSVKKKTDQGETLVYERLADGSVTPFEAHEGLFISEPEGSNTPFSITLCAIVVPR